MPGMSDSAHLVSSDEAIRLIAPWGFLVLHADLVDHAGPGCLLVAVRAHPTLAHYDPETIRAWRSVGGRGQMWLLDRTTEPGGPYPFAWGEIRIEDRLRVENSWAVFGGTLEITALEDDGRLFVLRSDAPILRAGGHSQGLDALADAALAFFGRLRSRVLTDPALEAAYAAAVPHAVEAAFLEDVRERASDDDERNLVRTEWARLEGLEPAATAAGLALHVATHVSPPARRSGPQG